MSYFNKAEYLSALFRMLPFGLGALIIGANGLLSKSSPDSLEKVTGSIIWYGYKDIYIKSSHDIDNAFVLDISNKSDTFEYHTFATNYIEILKEKKLSKGNKITVWGDEKIIAQILYNNELIIKYDGNKWLYVFFLLLGIIYTTITLLYLIKNPAFLSKKDN